MSPDPYMATIIGFGGNFQIRQWSYCAGQLLAISQNQALFSLLGTTFGGDGRTTFGLPDLRGRAPLSAGNGPGLTSRKEGARGGQEVHYLSVAEMPSHNHVMYPGYTSAATTTSPASAYPSDIGQPVWGNTPNGDMAHMSVGNTGGSQYHENRMPFLTINWLICVQGLFPSRN